MRLLLTLALAISIAVFSASVLPWIPLIRWLPPVTTAVLVLLVWPFRLRTGITIIGTASVLTDAIAGYPMSPRAVMLLAAGVLCWPLMRSYARQRRFVFLTITAIVFAFAEVLAAASAAGGFPPTRWAPLLHTLWPAVAWGFVLSFVLHRMVVRRRSLSYVPSHA